VQKEKDVLKKQRDDWEVEYKKVTSELLKSLDELSK
jgi:hypothetical protein